jgi:hypothetical protein
MISGALAALALAGVLCVCVCGSLWLAPRPSGRGPPWAGPVGVCRSRGRVAVALCGCGGCAVRDSAFSRIYFGTWYVPCLDSWSWTPGSLFLFVHLDWILWITWGARTPCGRSLTGAHLSRRTCLSVNCPIASALASFASGPQGRRLNPRPTLGLQRRLPSPDFVRTITSNLLTS